VPWKEIQVVEQREKFILAHLRGEASLAQLCREHGVSRKTGYKWVRRFLTGGMPALLDGSRAPLSHPQAVPEETVEAIVALKKRRLTWGPKKLKERLRRSHPEVEWPSESTFARILKRHGLVQGRRRMRRIPLCEHRLAAATEPNHIWCADFKGKFRVGNRYCHPLTISDACSRYVLCCEDTGGERFQPTLSAFERTFSEYGLPLRMRTDNILQNCCFEK
jgi:transposase-like protein